MRLGLCPIGRRNGAAADRGQFTIASSVQYSSCSFLVWPSPLLEEKSRSCLSTLTANLQNPRFLDGAGMGTRLATGDNTFDVAERQIAQRTNQRLQRQEMHNRRDRDQMRYPSNDPFILDRRSQPDIGISITPVAWQRLGDAVRPLC